tara:strand:- start:384 stop:1268 length:885 start_codon:yes stop_codon:yes gene_type:complete
MRLYFLITLTLTISSSALSQRLNFNQGEIDSVIIHSYLGSGFYNNNGESVLKRNRICISYDSLAKTFRYNYYKDIKIIHYKSQKTPKKIGTENRKYSNKKVNIGNLDSLLYAFCKQIPADQSLEDLKKDFEKDVSKSKILDVAKNHDADWHFKMKYTTKSKNKTFFNKCASLDTFQLYLESRFLNKDFMYITDYSNGFGVTLYTKDSTYNFEGTYPDPFKQPWFNENEILVSKDTLTNGSIRGFIQRESVLNFNINKYLTLLLPNDFLLRQSISSDGLFEDYIKWYLKRRRIIY